MAQHMLHCSGSAMAEPQLAAQPPSVGQGEHHRSGEESSWAELETDGCSESHSGKKSKPRNSFLAPQGQELSCPWAVRLHQERWWFGKTNPITLHILLFLLPQVYT